MCVHDFKAMHPIVRGISVKTCSPEKKYNGIYPLGTINISKKTNKKLGHPSNGLDHTVRSISIGTVTQYFQFCLYTQPQCM